MFLYTFLLFHGINNLNYSVVTITWEDKQLFPVVSISHEPKP